MRIRLDRSVRLPSHQLDLIEMPSQRSRSPITSDEAERRISPTTVVALLQQQLGQIGAVLAGDAGDEGSGHGLCSPPDRWRATPPPTPSRKGRGMFPVSLALLAGATPPPTPSRKGRGMFPVSPPSPCGRGTGGGVDGSTIIAGRC